MSRNTTNEERVMINFRRMLYPRDSVEVKLASKDEAMSMDIDMNGQYRSTPTFIRNVLQRDETPNGYSILVTSCFFSEDEEIVNYGSQIAH